MDHVHLSIHANTIHCLGTCTGENILHPLLPAWVRKNAIVLYWQEELILTLKIRMEILCCIC